MWMLSFVSDEWLLMVVNTILIAGTIATVLSFFVINRLLRFFPPIAGFIPLIQLVSVLILAAGVYFKGSYQTEAEWREKVAEWKTKAEDLQNKVNLAEKASQDLNVKLEEERKRKQRVRVEYITTVKTELREVEKIINAECKVDTRATEIHNKAAKEPAGDKK